MPTVIDSLVVEFGLDPSKFTQGQKEAMEAMRRLQAQALAGGKEVEAQGAKFSEYFGRIKREALGFAGLLFGGASIKEFIQNITTLDAATSRMSRILNLSAHELSAWQNTARLAGGSAESITGALNGFNQEINRFMLTGQGSFLPVLNAMGLSLKDEQGNIKTTTDLFVEMSEAMEKMNPENKGRSAAMLSMIPGMNQETINLLLKGPDNLRQMVSEMRTLTVVSTENAEQAERLASAWARAETTAVNIGRAILNWSSPAMEKFLDVLSFGMQKLSGGEVPQPMKDRVDKINEEQKRKQAEIDQRLKPSAPPGRLYNNFMRFFGAKPDAQASSFDEQGFAGFLPPPAAKSFAGVGGTRLITITTNGGRKVTVAEESAPSFLAFLNELEARGAPLGKLGGYNPRNIFGTNIPSEHAKGRAIDMGSMTGRDKIDPALRQWINEHEGEWRELLSRHNMRSGGDFSKPDLGHVEHGGAGFGATTNDNRKVSGDSSVTTITIGKIELPNVTDAQGFARDMAQLSRGNMAASANTALQG